MSPIFVGVPDGLGAEPGGGLEIVGLGCATPLGCDPEGVARAILAGESAIRAVPHLELLEDPRGAVVAGPASGTWLKRKKDLKMMPRAAVLALVAAESAMKDFSGNAEDLPLLVAVNREPPECDDAEASLVAMHRGTGGAGKLDPDKLQTGLALYPPLLPLRTLPNMILAHVSIAYGIRGENATFAGGAEAGVLALATAYRWLSEGRGEEILVGAAYAGVDLASARDRLRLGKQDPPGEAAIFARVRLAAPERAPQKENTSPSSDLFRRACGDCGPVEGLARVLFR